MPPIGSPPLSLKGFALTVVIVSKHAEKATFGARDPFIIILAEVAGLPETQLRFEVIRQITLSPFAGT
jgi:hypothetical protein